MQDDEVLREVGIERTAQKMLFSMAYDDGHTDNDWIAIMARHVGLAANDGGADDHVRFRRQMVRVAALAVAAIEAVDRRYRP